MNVTRGLQGAVLALVLVASRAHAAEPFEAKVVEIMDGDTVGALRTDTRGYVKIRLAEIDAPEKSQPFGNQSKKSLSDLVFSKIVRVSVQTTDRYGRLVARLYTGETDVSAAQLRAGMAWVYTRYSRDPKLPAFEAEARAARRGLWSDAHPVAPWDYRRGLREAKPRPAPAAAKAPGRACGEKRYCKQMQSCAEAKFYLQHCGVEALDRDGDGIPCESLCQ